MRSSVTSEMRSSPSDITRRYSRIAESAERAVGFLNSTDPSQPHFHVSPFRCPRPLSRPSLRIPDSVAVVIGRSTGVPLLRCFSSHFTAETTILIVPGALPWSNRCVIYSASNPSGSRVPCSASRENVSEPACDSSQCFRQRIFRLNLAVGCGLIRQQGQSQFPGSFQFFVFHTNPFTRNRLLFF